MRFGHVFINTRPHGFWGRPLFWLLLATFVVRFHVFLQLGEASIAMDQVGDMRFYQSWAERIASGQLTDGKAFYGMPGYAYLLAFIYKVAAPEPFLVGLLQVGSETAIAGLIYLLALRCIAPAPRARAVGTMAALGWAFYQPAQAFAVVLMPTTWLVLGFWATVLLLADPGLGKRPAWHWAGIGLLIGVCALLVATILLLLPLALATLVLHCRRRLLLPLLALAAGLVLGTAPCWIYNYFVAREPVLFSAHSGLNFYIGNNPIANGYPQVPPGMRAGQAGMLRDSITMAEAEAGRPLTRTEVSKHWSQKANAYIREHPLQWLRLLAIKFRNFWNVLQYDDLGLITLLRLEGVLTPGLRFGSVAVLGLAGMALGLRTQPRTGWIASAVLLHLCAILPVFITERYRLAAVPGLLLFAGLGLIELWEGLRARLWPRTILYLVCAGAAGLFVFWPLSSAFTALDDYNTGFRALEAGKLEHARQFLEKALPRMPGNAEAHFALGNLWLEKEDPQKAKFFYRRTLELNPGHDGAYNNLGFIALQEGRWEVAENFLRRALALEPGDAKTHYLLARARLGAGDPGEARQLINKALQLEPGRKLFREFAEQLPR